MLTELNSVAVAAVQRRLKPGKRVTRLCTQLLALATLTQHGKIHTSTAPVHDLGCGTVRRARELSEGRERIKVLRAQRRCGALEGGQSRDGGGQAEEDRVDEKHNERAANRKGSKGTRTEKGAGPR
jgi:hypothetical protein